METSDGGGRASARATECALPPPITRRNAAEPHAYIFYPTHGYYYRYDSAVGVGTECAAKETFPDKKKTFRYY